jgi:hypothetical protein
MKKHMTSGKINKMPNQIKVNYLARILGMVPLPIFFSEKENTLIRNYVCVENGDI